MIACFLVKAVGIMFKDRDILITGGTGSFGRKFVEIMLKEGPRRLIVLSRDELKQHEMRQQFPDYQSGRLDSPMRYFIGDVRDRDRLMRAFNGVDIVVHAAALKQVPACEYNPFEAIKTNILGTKNVIDAAIAREVERVMLISTDKAVNPVNLYGATKLCAEKMVVQGNFYSAAGSGGTKLSVCRYGNVLGSRGSVVPLFREQAQKGCITLTDDRMTRFWVTLEQGAQFVKRCIEKMKGGEIFVPKLPSMKIVDMARHLAPGCETRVIGIRPGEKVHEVLVSVDEARQALEMDDFFLIQPTHPWWRRENWIQGRELQEGYYYNSNDNPWQLSAGELEALLSQAGLD